MKFVNSRVVKHNFRNPKVVNRYLRNPNIIPNVDLIKLPFGENDCIPILRMCLYHAISVQTDSVNMESVVRCGQRIPKLDTL